MAEKDVLEPVSALELLAQHTQRFSFGCPVLDECAGGGIPLCGITEIAGESSAGKTQLCLQLLLQAQLPQEYGGLDSAALYVSTEGEPPMKRLQELALHFVRRNRGRLRDEDVQSNVFVDSVLELEDILELLDGRLPTLLRVKKVKLVVIDSIAAPFRGEYDFSREEMIRRSRVLSTIAASMKRLSEEFRTCFVVTNQVSSVLGARWQPAGMTNKLRILGGAALPEKLHELAPALGLTWAHCVNTRFMLVKHDQAVSVSVEGKADEQSPLREMELVFSPCSPRARCFYVVQSDAVRGVRLEG